MVEIINMNRKEITRELSELTENLINPKLDTRIYMAKEVTFDYATDHAIRVDYMRFKPIDNTVSGIEHGDFYCYEIKSSMADFKSKNGHNFIGDYNYYVMPREVYEEIKNNIHYKVGVYCKENSELVCVKKAQRMSRNHPASEMLLMMFRSSARDILKIKKEMRKLTELPKINGSYDWVDKFNSITVPSIIDINEMKITAEVDSTDKEFTECLNEAVSKSISESIPDLI